MDFNDFPRPQLPSRSKEEGNVLHHYSPAPSLFNIFLIILTYSLVLDSGLEKGWPYQPSTTCGPETPKPRITLPLVK
ncbi:MAG: hypothetical protein Ct9H300mP20_17140 [Gammaproteobacteria bacterium]|nr:MAG: hypothetical protein Ct9H300mP20_17140 [Gammaproteobacteria bacterium]